MNTETPLRGQHNRSKETNSKKTKKNFTGFYTDDAHKASHENKGNVITRVLIDRQILLVSAVRYNWRKVLGIYMLILEITYRGFTSLTSLKLLEWK